MASAKPVPSGRSLAAEGSSPSTPSPRWGPWQAVAPILLHKAILTLSTPSPCSHPWLSPWGEGLWRGVPALLGKARRRGPPGKPHDGAAHRLCFGTGLAGNPVFLPSSHRNQREQPPSRDEGEEGRQEQAGG